MENWKNGEYEISLINMQPPMFEIKITFKINANGEVLYSNAEII